MISFRLFALILVTLVCREVAQAATPNALGTALLATGGLTLGFGLLHKTLSLSILMRCIGPTPVSGSTALSASTLSDSFYAAHESQALHSASRLRSILESLWVAALPATLLLTGWGSWLKTFDAGGAMHTLTLLGWFLPSLSLLLLLELTAAQFEQIACQPEPSAPPTSWQQLWLLRLRLGELPGLATCLVPVFIVATLADLSRVLVGEGNDSSLLLAGLCSLSIAVFLALLPNLLAKWMGAERCQDAALAVRVADFKQRLKLGRIDFRTLAKSRRWHGAAIVGWFPGFRQLWIGEGLLSKLSEREVDMVIMHELAHVSRNHFSWRLLPILAAGCVLGVSFAIPSMLPLAEGWEPLALQWAKIGGVAASTLCLLLGVSIIARRCELDADSQACELASRACPWASQAPQRAAQSLGSALTTLIGDDPDTARATWLHPSLIRRLENLRSTARRRPSADAGLASNQAS